MPVKIRLTRLGDGKYIEQVGYYDPIKNPADINIDLEKANSWINKGAIPSETVKALLRKAELAVSSSQ